MAIFYKYMSYVENLLTSPTIKLSSPNLLNDPFESHGVDDMRKFIYENYKSRNEPGIYANGIKITGDKARRAVENNPIILVQTSSVVSLTESNRSLLMWAHYANQHKGIVVGLEDDFLSEAIPATTEIPEKLIFSPMPIKVSYDTARFDLTEFDSEKMNMLELSKALATKLLTTKSDDWLYEKEHRCIVPIGVADTIIYNGKTSDRTPKIKRMISEGKIKINRTTKFIEVSDKIRLGSTFYKHLSSDEHVIFLKKINPQKIKSIFFGMRAGDDKIAKYFQDIENNPDSLGHIKMYKYDLCDKQFQILKTELKKEDYLL